MLTHVVQIIVVYFDQRLGAVHSKHWSEYAFLSLHQNAGQRVPPQGVDQCLGVDQL